MHRRSRLRACMVSLALLAGVVAPVATAPPASAEPPHRVPGQYIAKLYTEALGRAPHAAGWAALVDYFLANPCNTTTTKFWGKSFYNSAEFAALYALPDPNNSKHLLASRVIALYRGALNRDPAQSELNYWVSVLIANETTAQWTAIVDSVFDSTVFSSLVSSGICAGSLTKKDPSAYGWNVGEVPVPTVIPAGNTCGLRGPTLTRASLQSALDAAAPNGTVLLSQNAIVFLDGAIEIPSGVTLTTCGPAQDPLLPDPVPGRYATQARLVRTWNYGAVPATTWPTTAPTDPTHTATVVVAPGGHLDRVWVDGGRNASENYCIYANAGLNGTCINVNMKGGNNTTVTFTRQDNTGGWTHIFDGGGHSAMTPCVSGNTISNNLIAAYASSHLYNATHGRAQWSDGISVTCDNVQITDNTIIDATDIGIIVFRPCLPHEDYCWERQVANVTTTSGSTTITGPVGLFHLGDASANITGPGIPAGTTVAKFLSNSQLQLSAPATASGTITVTITNLVARVQKSDITNNTIVAAGNSNWGAVWLSTDESSLWKPVAAPIADYTGTTITGNHMWTSPAAHMQALIVTGVRVISGTIPGHAVTGGGTTAGSSVLTSSTGQFKPEDTGRLITGPNIPASAKIVWVKDAFEATVDVVATGTATGQTFQVNIGGHPDWTTRGTGAVIQNNDTNSQAAFVNVAVLANAMRNMTLTNNNFDGTRVAYSGVGGLDSSFPGWVCGAGYLTNGARAPILNAVSSPQGTGYWASGTFAPNYGTGNLDMTQVVTINQIEQGCMTPQLHY